jgi:hypothetical protein
MFTGCSKKRARSRREWQDPYRTPRAGNHLNRYPLAEPPPQQIPRPGERMPLPDNRYCFISTSINNFNRIIVAWGDGIFPTVEGNPAAPSVKLYRALKQVSRMLGRFPRGHRLAGQQRLLVLKVNENFSSQMPSCWSSGDDGHPALPNNIPPVPQRLQQLPDIWAVKQCSHCNKIWQRDVNACR